MKTFNDYSGNEAIDKLLECAPYINELLSDTEVTGNLSSKSWLDIGCAAVKRHKSACDNIRKALDGTESSSIGEAYGMAKVLSEILMDKDVLDFFTSMAKQTARIKSGSHMENTEGAEN